MCTEVYIISGFLGAGKTTLIQKLLSEAFKKDKVVLIENDFGEISVDAALLKGGGIEVKELNSGCICCSLSGDFVKSVKEIVERFHPDKLIIEPSGVGKLSDVVKACEDPRINKLINVRGKITVVDVKRCKKYLDNFGEFFEDQIQNAHVILLSRTENYPDKVNEAYELVKNLHAHATVFSKPWNQISSQDILLPKYSEDEQLKCMSHECGCHDHNEHDHHCSCEHSHVVDDTFDTLTIRTKRIFSMRDLKVLVQKMEQNLMGKVIRAKGIVRGANGYINLQYLPGDLQMTSCTTSGDMLCIIGQNLNQQELVSLFSEV